jgi:hypothetical protein
MSAVLAPQVLPAIGAAFEGGFFTDRILVDGRPHAIITAPLVDGQHPDTVWNSKRARVGDARSFCDSYANTLAMAKAGSQVAQWALDSKLNGYSDWALPARDVLERMYFRFKPTTEENWVYRNGENPSAIPAAYPYTAALPKQTELALFRKGGAEAFDPVWYWSSTQCEGGGGCAWAQYFDGGGQGNFRKGGGCRVRLVRTIAI